MFIHTFCLYMGGVESVKRINSENKSHIFVTLSFQLTGNGMSAYTAT